MEKENNVTVKDNVITVYKMENQFCVSDFIRCMQKAIKYIKRPTVIDKVIKIYCLCAQKHIFPDACVPIAALIQEYKKIYNIQIEVIIKNNNYLEKCHFVNPLNLNADEIRQKSNPLNKIFMYESNDNGSPQAAAINQAFADKLSKTTLCEDGVLQGMMWCVYEVMDNVILHSKSDYGYIMAQYHKKTNRIAICIYDCGIGIQNSLLSGGINTENEIEAINAAIQEGVSDGQGLGNGLYGLSEFVKENGGRLVISTGKSTLMLKNNETKSWDRNPVIDIHHKSTTVDFQLELGNKTDIKKALRSIGGIEDFDVRIEDMVQEQSNWLNYKVIEYAEDLGTRPAGKALKTDVLNIIRRTGNPIIIDFSDIIIVGSSFIDEFIGKMYIELGSVKFNQLISISNMNKDLIHLCNRAIAMRVKQEWELKNSISST